MSSRIDVISRYHATRSFGNQENAIARSKEVNAVYRELTEAEIAELVQRALEDKDRADAYLVCLACLQPGSLRPFHYRLIEHGVFYPSVIYHGADEQCAGAFAELTATLDASLRRNHLLLCMAWAGNAEVQRLFDRWRDSPPAWAADLHLPPHAYAQEAGWELLPNGERRDLYFQTTLPLIPRGESPEIESGVRVGTPTDEPCPWCARQLVSLLDIDSTKDAVSFLQLPRTRLQVTTCDVCSNFGVVFSKNNGKGEAAWHEANVRPDYLPKDSSDWGTFPECPLVLSGKSRHFMESANWTIVPDVSFSQIGGLPTWIQDAEYPQCPDCSQKMMFIGQISNEDFAPMMEGIEYCFVCPQCLVTATNYQQT